MASANPALPAAVARALRDLVDEAQAVAQQLGDEEGPADLEELARALQKVEDNATRVLAMMPQNRELQSARAHLHEARDLLDDGMPGDAAALEVLAAQAVLEASLKSG